MGKSNDNKRSIATLSPTERAVRQSTISKRVTSSKEEATKFLKKAGIITNAGNVSPHYRKG